MSTANEVLSKYQNNVIVIKEHAKSINLSDNEINEIFESCFKLIQNINVSKIVKPRKTSGNIVPITIKLIFYILFLAVTIYVLLNVHQPTSSIVLRNVQGLIYPGLKAIRFLAVPFLKQFPSLTKLYDETCLVENPLFYIRDMECWPCKNVHAVLDLTGFNNYSLYKSGIPYVVQMKQKYVNFEDVRNIYIANKEMFDKDADSIKSTNTTLKTVEDLFRYFPSKQESSKTHTVWRINRMAPARTLRSLFSKPYIVSPRAGQSIERFVMIDEPFATGYTLPNPDCSYVFIIQGSGKRTIIFKPAKECGSSCKTVSVVLKPSFALWYNWWYWRPISLPAENATEISISYMSCHY